MTKLRNGHIDTPTMIRLLTKHPTWTASAPYFGGIVAHNTGSAILAAGKTDFHPLFGMPFVFDWTIHRPESE